MIAMFAFFVIRSSSMWGICNVAVSWCTIERSEQWTHLQVHRDLQLGLPSCVEGASVASNQFNPLPQVINVPNATAYHAVMLR